jgi:hypothetical protein
MIKTLLILFTLCSSYIANAQGLSSSASQTIQIIIPTRVDVSNYLQVTTEKSNSKGNRSNTGILGQKEYFRVKANKNFTVSVQIETEGDNLPADALMKGNAVELKLSNMQPEINPFLTNYTRFTAISPTQQNVLMTCACGTDQQFAVNYKAKGRNRIVYTVTEP